jgi:hypothetical protein
MSTSQGKKFLRGYDGILFGSAAAWNLIGGLVLLVNPESQLTRLAITDHRAVWIVRSLASSAIAWGIGYLLIAIDSERFRQFIWLGLISKTLFALISAWGVADGALTGNAILPGAVDLVFALLFAERLLKRNTEHTERRTEHTEKERELRD